LDVKIPSQLQNKRFRFIKIKPNSKRPFENDWTETNNYKHTEPEFLEYLKTATAYGVINGIGGLAVIDEDHESIGNAIQRAIDNEKLPKTFIVKTGGGHRHFYYIIRDLEKKIILEDIEIDGKNIHRGEIQWKGTQVLGSGSLHPNGEYYKILEDNPIAEITQEQILTILESFLREDDKKLLNKWNRWEQNKPTYEGAKEPNLTQIINVAGMSHRGDEYQGIHPIHGSKQGERGSNFTINTKKNLWHCFRCNSGGNVWTWIAVIEGIIDCKDAQPGCLKDKKKFKKVIKIAKEKHGVKDPYEVTKEEAIKLNKERIQDIKDKPTTLTEVYEKIQKWLFLPDTERVDIILAVTISVKDKSKPLWIFFVGGSGDAKSELLKGLDTLTCVRKVDQLTTNTLASGKKDVKDLGYELQNADTLLIFTDLACLTSLNKDEKKKIWGQFRTLYDGEIYKDTGSDVKKKYNNCNVSILAATTSAIKEEYHIHQQLGTRELLYDTNPDPRDNKTKMLKALKNNGKEKQMQQEIKEAIMGFLVDKKFNPDIEMPEEIKDFLFKECEKLRILRASGSTDWKTGEVNIDMEAEVTTRLIQQFSKLYKAFHSLDENYSDDKFKKIIEHFVMSSSNVVRYKIYEYFKKHDEWHNAFELHQKLKIARLTIAAQCEALWNLGSLKKEFREETIGYEGSNRWKQVAYYKPNFSLKNSELC